MPFLDELISGAPKQLRATLWVVFLMLGFALFGGWLFGRVSEQAEAATAPLADRVTKLEAAQLQISTALNAISTNVAVLAEHVKTEDKERRSK